MVDMHTHYSLEARIKLLEQNIDRLERRLSFLVDGW